MKGVLKFCFKRVGSLLLSSFFCSSALVNAQTLVTDPSNGLACPGEAIVLTAKGFDGGEDLIEFYADVDGKTKLFDAGLYRNATATGVYDMTSSPVTFYAKGQKTGKQTQKVTVSLNSECQNVCQLSSSGDYISGTDFNIPLDNLKFTDPNKPYSETAAGKQGEIESRFNDYKVDFRIKDCSANGGKSYITNDVESYLKYLPKANSSQYSNFYWIAANSGFNELNCTPFDYEFQMYDGNEDYWNNKYYRLAIKVYIVKGSGCNECKNAKFKLETGSGSQGVFVDNADHMDVVVYDDKTDEVLARPKLEGGSFGYVYLSDDLCKTSMENRLLRLEIRSYGKFHLQNRQESIRLSPRFEQLGCMKVAVDYISAEMMSVCMQKSAPCVGDLLPVVAAGFPHGANYVWEKKTDNGSWVTLRVDGFEMKGEDKREIQIPVERLGKQRYRVYDSKTVNKGSGLSSEYIEFDVVGRNCDPVQPTDIEGAETFCVPNEMKYKVSPVDPREGVTYTWSLKDPNGKVYYTDHFKLEGFPEEYGDVKYDGRGAEVALNFKREIPDGEYVLTVQPVQTESLAGGDTETHEAGEPISKKIKIFKRADPVMTLTCEGCEGLSEEDKELCPTDKSQKIEVSTKIDPNSPYVGNYVFTWTGAKPKKNPAAEEATVDLVSEAVCSGATKSHNVGVTVAVRINGVDYCPSSDNNQYKIKDVEVPKIACTQKTRTETLAADECKKNITFTFPGFTAGCTTHPSVKVELAFQPADGSAAITKTITLNSIAIGEIQSRLNQTANRVQLPAGKGTVKYTVTDDCDNSDVCTQTIEVKDVTAPSVDCSKIKDYTVKLSEVSSASCQAATGVSSKLPTITAPELLDEADPCAATTIVGVYEGRTVAQETDDVLPYDTKTHREVNYEKAFPTDTPNDDPYDMGYTYILWSFTDASGNTSYCTQKVTVIDDSKPILTCPDYSSIDVIGNEAGKCGLSVDGLLAWMSERNYKTPSARDVCSGKNAVITPSLYYSANGGSLKLIKPTDYGEMLFQVNEEYKLVWRFKKTSAETFVDASTYVDCSLTFTVKDTEAPAFDCTSLSVVRVTANRYKPKDQPYKYLDYASQSDVKVGKDTYEGTLKAHFEDGLIKMLTPDMAEDNCTADLTVSATLTGPDEKGRERTLTIRNTADLEKVLYGIGVTTITYTFTDEAGNATSCEQFVMVTSGPTPIPSCVLEYDTVYADENCSADYLLKKADVPTAIFPVDIAGFYFNFKYPAIAGLHFGQETGPSGTGVVCEDVLEYFPDYITQLDGTNKYKSYMKGGPGGMEQIDLDVPTICEWAGALDKYKADNNWSNFLRAPGAGAGNLAGTILEPSNTYTTIENYDGYPFKIELLDSDGNLVKEVKNQYTAEDDVPTQRIVPRAFDGSGKEIKDGSCYEASIVCGSVPVKVKNNFKSSELEFKNLKKGVYTMIFHYEDRENGEQTARCTRMITVVDTVPPTVVCGDWAASQNLVANAECVVPTAEVEIIKKPTVGDLQASDNCTPAGDMKITIVREYEDGSSLVGDDALAAPLPMGTTYIHYIVSDGSEYSKPSTCTQSFLVEDKTGPYINCSRLVPITGYADETCAASYDNLVENGYRTPYAKQDPCSPNPEVTEKGIRGTSVRSDGKRLTAPYALENSPIVVTWTFVDGVGNATVCEQVINVVDTVLPVFDCSEIKDVTYYPKYDECEVSKSDIVASLGDYKATDNCSGEVKGVPYLLDDVSGDTIALPSKFEPSKDYIIIWRFTDESGNTKACHQNLMIRDTFPPKLGDVCPDDVVVDATEETGCSVDFEHLNLPEPEAISITDACDGVVVPELQVRLSLPGKKVSVLYGLEEAKAASYPVGTHVAYWIYKDKAVPSNSDTCFQNITVLDAIKPILADCDDVYGKKYSFTVEAENCEFSPERVNKLLVHPKAYDECDSYLSGDISEDGTPLLAIDPIIERYDMDTTTTPAVYTLYADGVNKLWDEDNFKKGAHMLRWIFKDNSGNEVTCEKYIYIIDATGPYFDCSKINPDTLRPETNPGECEVEFADLKRDVLDKLAYKAWDACAADSIPGVLTLNGTMELPSEYTMKVGITYKLLWLFKDEDGNKTTCPQWILPSHRNPIDFDCSTLKPLAFEADKGECFASSENIKANVPTPKAKDACSDYMVEAVPFFVSGKDTAMIDMDKDNFSTGDTTIHWMFVSIWNIHDTLWCTQPVSVLGNKAFDLDCDVIAPTVKDTIENCGPSEEATAKVVTPWVADPCADPDSPEYRRYGVGLRLDSTAAHPAKISDPYPLGDTRIRWVFTDFTGNVSDTCVQTINVRTTADIVVDCDSLKADTIKSPYQVPEGVCTVSADLVGIDSADLVVPNVKHPCLDDVAIKVTTRRKNGKSWTDDYIVGVNWIEWIFVDTSHTTIKDTLICEQPIQVGDDDATLFDCDNIKPKRIELDENNCTIDATALNFQEGVPEAHDACGETKGELIVPKFTRTSGLGLDEPFTVGKDTIVWNFYYASIDDSVVCEQPIHVLDSKEPLFDCGLLPDTTLASAKGKCYLEKRAIREVLDSLAGVHKAKDACIDTILISAAYDEEVIPEMLNVGDTITIHWVFQDTLINLVAKTCDQKLTVIGDIAPIFDCEAWPLDTFKTDGCDIELTELDIKTPKAVDACTSDSIAGVGSRLDGAALYGKYPVGTTAIQWIFKSDFSTVADTCVRYITVLTTQEIGFDCETLAKDTVKVNVEEGNCSTEVTMPSPVANHPCPQESGVTTILGVPSLAGTLFSPNADSTEWKAVLPTGVWSVTWTFADHSQTMVDSVKVCEQPVKVGDINEMPVDCKNYPDTVIVLSSGDCDLTWDEINFKQPEVVDLCTNQAIVPELTRWSGKRMDEPFTVGMDTIYWSYSFSGQSVVCSQSIHLLDSVAPFFDCSTLEDIDLIAKEGTCEVSSEELVAALGEHSAIDSCTNAEVPGRAFVEGVSVESVSAKVGDTLIVHWVFIDSTLNAVAKECDQVVYVLGRNKPVFDCETLKDTILYLALDECFLDGAKLNLNIPVAKDSCTGIDVPGVASRQDGKLMTDLFEKGATVVDWSFKSPHSIAVRTCPQNVVVKDTLPPAVLCEEILKDTIKVRITEASESGDYITPEEAVSAGLATPSVSDPCDEVKVTSRRSDGKLMTDNYLLNTQTTITWIFEDESGNRDSCSQVVVVEDWVLDELICPNDIEEDIHCLENIPEAYTSYEEFKLAGGSFSNEAKLVADSFRVLADEVPSEHCDFYVVRTYQVKDVRNHDIQCKQRIHVTDKVAPTLSETPVDITLACTDEIPAAVVLTAVDDCIPTEVSVAMEETSTRGTDPNSCDYYNYTITRIWTAVDRCENEVSHRQNLAIVDTLSPEFNFPPSWKDTVLSIYSKGCIFGVPDFTVEVKSIVTDNCTDVTNIKVTQTPAPHTLIKNSTAVKVIVEDMCGNQDSLFKFVLVPQQKSVVNLTAYDTVLCASDEHPIELTSQHVRFARGEIKVEWDGEFYDVPTTFVFDYYLDSISSKTLLYSDNPNTYLDRFSPETLGSSVADSIKNARVKLRKQLQSGNYWFVAMDTLTLCTDTAHAYLDIRERPRITMDSGLEKVCEFNGLDSLTLNAYVRCVNDMGSTITADGWLLDGKKYAYGDSIHMAQDSASFVYYAENACGRSTSKDTYYNFCLDDVVPTTRRDTMKLLGADSVYYHLFRSDDYKVRDSIVVDVYDRLKSDAIFVTVNEKERSTIWLGDEVKLSLHSNYGRLMCQWYAVNGKFDRRFFNADGGEEFRFQDDDDVEDELVYQSYIHDGKASLTRGPRDTTAYYVVLSNEVCPAVSGNVVTVNVNDKLPTAITPITMDGLNDVFMETFPVKIFNRYSQLIFEGVNGWNGVSNGEKVDPGVYFYEVVMRDGSVLQGTIEVVLMR